MDAVPIGEVVGELVKQLLRPMRVADRANRAWAQVTGEYVAGVTLVTALRDGVLYLTTPSAPLMFELQMRESDYCTRLREEHGLNVSRLRVRLDGRP